MLHISGTIKRKFRTVFSILLWISATLRMFGSPLYSAPPGWSGSFDPTGDMFRRNFSLEEAEKILNRYAFNGDLKVEIRKGSGEKGDRIFILVEQGLYEMPGLAAAADEFTEDLADEGWEFVLGTFAGGDPEQMRSYLQEQLSGGINGVYFIGDAPFALYEMGYEIFPFDVFYMDLEIEWLDTDANGFYDAYREPGGMDIFVARTDASRLTLGEFTAPEKVMEYLGKTGRFREGRILSEPSGCLYIDDDFVDDEQNWIEEAQLGISEVDSVTDAALTSAADYKEKLRAGYRWMMPFGHASPTAQYFQTPEGGEAVLSTELAGIDPSSLFYINYGCTNGMFSVQDCMTTWYTMTPNYGLTCIGNSKIGAMYLFDIFFRELKKGRCIGEAFRVWADAWILKNPDWFLGLNIQGDPTLIPFQEPIIVEHNTSGRDDGRLPAGETVQVELTAANFYFEMLNDLSLRAVCTDEYFNMEETIVSFGDANPRERVMGDTFLIIAVDASCPDDYEGKIEIVFSDENESTWEETLCLKTAAPAINVQYVQWQEADDPPGSNDNLIPEPGETGFLSVHLTNYGHGTFSGGTAQVETSELFIDIAGEATIPELQPGESGICELQAAISPDHPPVHYAYFELIIAEQNIIIPFILPVGAAGGFSILFDRDFSVFRDYPATEGCENEWNAVEVQTGERKKNILFYGSPNPESPYASGADGAAETPFIKLPADARLSFKHKMNAEPDFDLGIVEVFDGSQWTSVEPVGGYPSESARGNMINPFGGVPCFTGRFDWKEEVFDLSDFAGPAKLRFRFSNDGGVGGEGWKISDFVVTSTDNSLPPQAFIHTNQTTYGPGDPFAAELQLRSFYAEMPVAHYIILQYKGQNGDVFLYYPEWTENPAAVDYFFPAMVSAEAAILEFELPDSIDDAEFSLWTALTDPDSGALVSAPAKWDFSFRAN